MKKLGLVATAAALVTIAASAFAAEPPLPKGYTKWEKSKKRVITDKKSMFYGIHYIYVDKKAAKTYKSGGTYPEGSRFVVENFTIKDAAAQTPGKKSMIVLMQKDKKQTATGGWLFAGYTPDGKPSGIEPKICFECHERDAKTTDYVISKYADFK